MIEKINWKKSIEEQVSSFRTKFIEMPGFSIKKLIKSTFVSFWSPSLPIIAFQELKFWMRTFSFSQYILMECTFSWGSVFELKVLCNGKGKNCNFPEGKMPVLFQEPYQEFTAL